jgi:hypothetical protein
MLSRYPQQFPLRELTGHGIFHVFGQVNQPHFELYVDVSIVVVLAAVKQVHDIEVSTF